MQLTLVLLARFTGFGVFIILSEIDLTPHQIFLSKAQLISALGLLKIKATELNGGEDLIYEQFTFILDFLDFFLPHS